MLFKCALEFISALIVGLIYSSGAASDTNIVEMSPGSRKEQLCSCSQPFMTGVVQPASIGTVGDAE